MDSLGGISRTSKGVENPSQSAYVEIESNKIFLKVVILPSARLAWNERHVLLYARLMLGIPLAIGFP